jgi:hypothetical protein
MPIPPPSPPFSPVSSVRCISPKLLDEDEDQGILNSVFCFLFSLSLSLQLINILLIRASDQRPRISP